MQIIICSTCEGSGKIEVKERFQDLEVTCTKCEGNGRVYCRNYTLEISLNEMEKFIQADEKIMTAIREVKK